MIMLDMEVQLVWYSSWNLTKVMYLLNRYLVIVDFAINYFRMVSLSFRCQKDDLNNRLKVLMVCALQLANHYSKQRQVSMGCCCSLDLKFKASPMASALTVIYTFALYLAECKFLFYPLSARSYRRLLNSRPDTLALRVCIVWKMNRLIIVVLATIYGASFVYVLTNFYIMLRPVVCEYGLSFF